MYFVSIIWMLKSFIAFLSLGSGNLVVIFESIFLSVHFPVTRAALFRAN